MCVLLLMWISLCKDKTSLFQDVSGSFNPLEGLDKTKSQGWCRTHNQLVQQENFELSRMILKAK